MYERFRELCRINGVTVRQVANETGLNESSLSNWKKRKGGINTETLVAICKYFNVSADWFLGLDIDVIQPDPASMPKRIMEYAKRLSALPIEYQNKIFDQLDYQEYAYSNEIKKKETKSNV